MGVGDNWGYLFIFNIPKEKMNKKGELNLGNVGAGFWKILIVGGIIIAFATGLIPVVALSKIPALVWGILIVLLLFLITGGRRRR